MSRDIVVNVQRVNASVPAINGVSLQLDNLPLSEVLYYDGVAAIERFTAYAQMGTYDIRQTDLLIDTVNIDPKTSTNYQYRVMSIPEAFPDQHMELICDLYRGGM